MDKLGIIDKYRISMQCYGKRKASASVSSV